MKIRIGILAFCLSMLLASNVFAVGIGTYDITTGV